MDIVSGDKRKGIEIRDVTKFYTGFWGRKRVRAVHNLTLRVGRGEICGLLGPNGSGKTTTLKMLIGLTRPTKGEITLLGESPRKKQVREKVGFLPEESYMYQFLTGRRSIHFYGSLFGIPRGELRSRTESLLAKVGLTDAAERRVCEYSRGMARRLGLAQALINDPELLLLDEPTAGLDPFGAKMVTELLLELAQSGKTVLLSSHIISDMEKICTRIAIMNNGSLVAEGPTRSLLAATRQLTIVVKEKADLSYEKLRSILTDAGLEVVDMHSSVRELENLFFEVIREKSSPAL